MQRDISASAEFLSTPSARRATGFQWQNLERSWISIHALREEGDLCPRCGERMPDISIHALREEGDFLDTHCVLLHKISIHALREEGDSKNREIILCFCLIIHIPAQIAKRSL